MKIKEKDGTVVDIFAIYSLLSAIDQKMKTYLYGIPKGYSGLMAFTLDEVDIIENAFKSEMVVFTNRGTGVYHWALIQENLLDDLLERDEDAYNRFLEIIKSEGLVDPDFY
ncbi:MAG: hypothetical protein J6583_04640 [Gilliamella sp.]|uniref:hypothetical protein n=1 Tax=Gilliamella sp. TaxID=1891236 RepID=UPI0025E17C2D|nr:hypothetical protein [Gilliamella sp.]MCO6545913.1 hypothetical protein [Gilliamella sp.]MCO6547049.1 hypothetical protein [Gilliamella sp.]